MYKIQAIGAPFDIRYSSCGKLSPSLFLWTSDYQDIQVYIDNGMVRGCDGKKHNKKFGWFCESRIIKNNIYTDILFNLNKYKNSYYKIFTCDRSLVELDKNLFVLVPSGSNLPWTPKSEYKLYNKTKLISLISSEKNMTSGHQNRLLLAEKFKNKVDFYGGIFGSEKIGIQNANHYHHCSKSQGLYDYMFSITIENCKYDDYFTEKITDCFATGTIPIYYGTENVIKYFDSNGIIFLNDNFKLEDITTDLYYSKIDAIKNNLDIISNMLSADDYLFLEIQKNL